MSLNLWSRRSFLWSTAALATAATGGGSDVRVLRLSSGALQPRTVVDEKGLVHLSYFRGEPAAGDVFYSRLRDGAFPEAIRVNDVPGSSIALGRVRGPQIAVGRNGRVHVAWNGSEKKRPPMYYARLDDSGRKFEPQRNVIGQAYGLDGGGGVAASGDGVTVFWHAPLPGKSGEAERRVWAVSSSDAGKSFGEEAVVSKGATGACGCCGLAAFANSGQVFALYRSAEETVHRDMYLLSRAKGATAFTSRKVDEWNVGACVMSTEAFADSEQGVYAAWETRGQVRFAKLDAAGGVVRVTQPSGEPGGRKHPVLAVNKKGSILLAWTEGTGYSTGGSLGWQVFDSSGAPASGLGRAAGVPPHSFAAAYAEPEGGFAVVF